MHLPIRIVLVAAVLPLLGGCVARTVVGMVTAPVKVASKAVDLATTSQSEADEKRGRALRRSEERLGELERIHQQAAQRCAEGDDRACLRRDAAEREIEALRPYLPAGRR